MLVLVYTMLTELPVFILYESSFWSGVFLIIIFAVSVWNGGGFYIEVFGRKCVNHRATFYLVPNGSVTRFERELEALRRELAEGAASRSGIATPADGGDFTSHSRTASEDNLSLESPVLVAKDLGPSDLVPTPSISVQSESSDELEPKKDR